MKTPEFSHAILTALDGTKAPFNCPEIAKRLRSFESQLAAIRNRLSETSETKRREALTKKLNDAETAQSEWRSKIRRSDRLSNITCPKCVAHLRQQLGGAARWRSQLWIAACDTEKAEERKEKRQQQAAVRKAERTSGAESEFQDALERALNAAERITRVQRINTGLLFVDDGKGGNRKGIRMAKAGTADLVGFVGGGHGWYLEVEVKAAKGRPRKSQLMRAAAILRAGGIHLFVWPRASTLEESVRLALEEIDGAIELRKLAPKVSFV